MSNQQMGTAPADGEKSTRKEFEELLESNLRSAANVLSLACQVGDFLFGAKPIEDKVKENAETESSSFFNRARNVAVETRIYLGNIMDELQKIIKELK